MPGVVPPVADEREGLIGFLGQQRAAVRIAAHGLDDAQARATPTVSALSVGGIVKHLTSVERYWTSVAECRAKRGGADEYREGFVMRPHETLGGLLSDYGAATAETDRTVASIDDLGRDVPIPEGSPFGNELGAWSVRWILLHLLEETARHAGHADIVREAIDGAGAFPLMAAAEDWPEVPWLTRWEPTARGDGA